MRVLDYFDRCLAALRGQTLPVEQWDLLIVDNRSDRPVASAIDLSWHANARVVCESTLGLTPARLRGIRERRADLLVFVDDDNVLAPDYLQRAVAIANEYPFLGAWSGQCLPEFDVRASGMDTPLLGHPLHSRVRRGCMVELAASSGDDAVRCRSLRALAGGHAIPRPLRSGSALHDPGPGRYLACFRR